MKAPLHWKIRRDPYLAPLCEHEGEEAATAAGFFFDEDDVDAPLDDVDWLSTPFPKRASTGKGNAARPVVLLSTGGFCPPHHGHLEMMDRARDAAERAGFDVLGGYLSPGHDAYLRLKCGDAALPAHERLRLCAEAVATSDWLSVDPWEAMHRRVSVNYTDVTARLRAYLRAHVDPRIEVLYVCGGDNARFALAFTHHGGCVVVGRPNAEDEHEAWRRRLGDHPRVLWAPGDHPAASRELRSGTWREPPPRRLVLRLEDERAVKTLGLGQPAYRAFQAALRELLSVHASVRTAMLDDVDDDGRAAREARRAVINLDAMRSSPHDLAISRLFALGGYEALGHVARPGARPLAEQVREIPPGEYVLEDDDRMTGGTLAAVRALLPETVVVTTTRLAVPHAADEDVADARDFLLGADEGGLVVALPPDPSGAPRVGRAPYALPYVDPAVRASILASRSFSIDVWSLNARTFAPTSLCVRDLPAPARATLLSFADEVRLDAVCEWHAARLRALAR